VTTRNFEVMFNNSSKAFVIFWILAPCSVQPWRSRRHAPPNVGIQLYNAAQELRKPWILSPPPWKPHILYE